MLSRCPLLLASLMSTILAVLSALTWTIVFIMLLFRGVEDPRVTHWAYAAMGIVVWIWFLNFLAHKSWQEIDYFRRRNNERSGRTGGSTAAQTRWCNVPGLIDLFCIVLLVVGIIWVCVCVVNGVSL